MDSEHILSTSFGILASLAFLNYFAKNTNTEENRKAVVTLILNNLNIIGFNQLSEWLSEDGFIKGTYQTPAGVNQDSTLTIGAGGGKTVIKAGDVDNWLRNLTASNLSSAVNKAINLSPIADTVQDRQKVLEWLSSVTSKVKNFDLLYRDLISVDWISSSRLIPDNSNIPATILLGNKKRIWFYHKFLLSSDTTELLKLIDELIYPTDDSIEERQLTYLIVSTSADAGVTGFSDFLSYLSSSGFISSPQTHLIPSNLPDTLLLGGTTFTKQQLTNILQNATPQTIKAIASTALQSYDSTLTPRINAIALLQKNMNNFVRDETSPYQNFLLSDLYPLLVSSGFITSPRKFTPVDTSKYTTAVYSYGWTVIPDLSIWLQNATADDVNSIANTGSTESIHYLKYLAYLTSQYETIQNDMMKDSNQPNLGDTFIGRWQIMYESGLPVSPPNPFNERSGFSNVAGGCGINAPFSAVNQNIWDDSTSVTGLWTGKPSADLLVVDFFIGTDPNSILGVFVKTDSTGKANPYYCDSTFNIALALGKSGKPVLMPK